MKKSLRLGLGSCALLFAVGGVLSYLALGDNVGKSFLLAFEDTAPAWVLVLGSAMIVLNMVPAYQVGRRSMHTCIPDTTLSRSAYCQYHY